MIFSGVPRGIAVDGNPLQDVSTLAPVCFVMKGGGIG